MGKVIIVDNDLGALSLFEQMLEQYIDQYEIEFISEPEDAIAVLEVNDVNVLISELNMPLFTGSELFSLCKHISPKTIQIAMTKVEDVQETLHIVNECDLYKLILKPIHFSEDLISVIENALIFYEIQQVDEFMEEDSASRIEFANAEYKQQQLWMKNKETTFQALREMVLSLIEKDIDAGKLSSNLNTALIEYSDQILHDFTECFCCSIFSKEEFEKRIEEQFMGNGKTIFFIDNSIEDRLENHMSKLVFSVFTFLHTCNFLLESYQLVLSMEEKQDRIFIKLICRNWIERADRGLFREKLMRLMDQLIKVYFEHTMIGYGDNPYTLVATKNKEIEEILE